MNKKDTKILLVDDEPDIIEIVGYNLKNAGYQVFTANNGKEAIIQAEKHQPHLVILDVMMPMSWMALKPVKHYVRGDPKFAETIITFLTARGEDYSQFAGFNAGADDYITKPIKPKLLVSKVKGFVEKI